MNELSLLAEQDIEIYQSDIDLICKDYIDRLEDPKMIYKSSCFSGLLNYIYRFKLKDIIEYDKKKRNTEYYNNYELLDLIFNNIYIPLCNTYNNIPSIIQYCTFVKIDRENLYNILNGVSGVNASEKITQKTRDKIKIWVSTCESALYGKTATENGIGSMFLLKSVYNYQEQPKEVYITARSETPPEQIAERYKDATKPQFEEIENN